LQVVVRQGAATRRVTSLDIAEEITAHRDETIGRLLRGALKGSKRSPVDWSTTWAKLNGNLEILTIKRRNGSQSFLS
jgi:hypothetical protein